MTIPIIRVLVVDDYEPWRRLVCSRLQKLPEYQVIGDASDGLEGVRIAEQLQPDLILLDVALPSLNGIEVARRIRRISPASRILFVSENHSVEWATEALNTGAGGYVVKSDATKDLLRGIRAVVEGKRFISAGLAHHFLQATISISPISIPWLVTFISGLG